MTILQSIFLGAVQGLTEFLPISSSGHLVLFQKIFGFQEPPIMFDALLHFSTAVAILIFLRKEIKTLFEKILLEIKKKKRGEAFNTFLLLFIGTIPVVIIGVLLMDKIEVIFDSFLLVGISFFLTAIILFSTSFANKQKKNIKKINKIDALFIGFFQALAILPGLSRSGSTISAGLFRGIKKEDAFNFSFLLGFVAILGANILQIFKVTGFEGFDFLAGIIGFFSAFLVGLIALRILKPIVIKGKFYYFGIYCIFAGIICIIFAII